MDNISIFINEMFIGLGKKNVIFFLIITHEFN
jgi:hypothetical protein